MINGELILAAQLEAHVVCPFTKTLGTLCLRLCHVAFSFHKLDHSTPICTIILYVEASLFFISLFCVPSRLDNVSALSSVY